MDSIQHHGADSPWVIPVRDLTRGAGVQRELTAEWPAPAGVSTPLLGIPEGDPVELDLRCLLYTSPSPRDATLSRMPSSA